MGEQNGTEDRIPPGISREDWDATPLAVRRLVLARQDRLAVADRAVRSGPNLDLLPDRKSTYLFAARLLALILMIGGLLTYVLWDSAEPFVNRALVAVGVMNAPTPTLQPTRVTVLVPASIETTTPAGTPTPTATQPSGAPPIAPTKRVATPEPTAIPAAPIRVVSEDGLAVLALAPGTKVTDEEGKEVSSISTAGTSQTIHWDIAIVGQSYAFAPVGTTLDPPAPLTITYDPTAYYPFAYENIDCSKMHIAYFDPDKGTTSGAWLEVEVDREAHRVTTRIDHLGMFVLFCQVTGAPISFRIAPENLLEEYRM